MAALVGGGTDDAGGVGMSESITADSTRIIDLLNAAAELAPSAEYALAMQADIKALAASIQLLKERNGLLENELVISQQHVDEVELRLANRTAMIRADAIENARTWLVRLMAIETSLDAPTLQAVIGALAGDEDSPIQSWDREALIEAVESAAAAVELAREKLHHGYPVDDVG